jgi:hypothetical protein
MKWQTSLLLPINDANTTMKPAPTEFTVCIQIFPSIRPMIWVQIGLQYTPCKRPLANVFTSTRFVIAPKTEKHVAQTFARGLLTAKLNLG